MRENFIRPYFSKSLKEYWRRWHVSMSSWFRDYLFYPVSTSKWMQRFTRFVKARLGEKLGRRLPMYLSTFVVWFATGVWHGASWNFIVWGLANWVVLIASEELEPLYGKFHQRYAVKRKLWYRLFQVGRLFLLVCILNLFDCYPSLSLTFGAFVSIFTAGNWRIMCQPCQGPVWLLSQQQGGPGAVSAGLRHPHMRHGADAAGEPLPAQRQRP